MKMKSFFLASGLLALGAAGPAQAQNNVTLDLAHWVAPTHPMGQALSLWAQSVTQASEGRINIDIFPNAQLGGANDHFDLVNRGQVDIAFFNSGYIAGVFPIISVGELPFLFSEAPKGSRALHEWYQEYAELEMPGLKVCMAHIHDPGSLHGTVPILTPADIQGKVVRPANATMAQLITRLGGTTVTGGPGDMTNQLITGLTTLSASPWGSLFTWNAETVATHHLDIQFYSANFVIGINRATYDRLTPANRAVIDDHCNADWAEQIVEIWAESEASGRQRIIDRGGHTLHQPNEAQMQQWRDAAAFQLDDWKARVRARYPNLDPDAIYESFIATLRRHGALIE